MAVTFNKRLDFKQLQSELQAAGINVPSLGSSAGVLYTYDANGDLVDLPANAQAVVNSHVAASIAQDASDLTDLKDLRDTLAAMQTRADSIISDMNTIINAPISTLAEARTAIKSEATAVRDLTTGTKRLFKAVGVIVRSKIG